MLNKVLRAARAGMMLFFLSRLIPASAQTVTAVPTFDLNKYMGVWYEIARLPDKKEKRCLSDAIVLYTLADKRNHFQMVTSCQIKAANSDAWNATGVVDKAGDGKLKITYIRPFSAKYWMLAEGPGSEWALVGSPNHKTLWILSRARSLQPEVLAEIKSKAAAQGFDLAKLITVAHRR